MQKCKLRGAHSDEACTFNTFQIAQSSTLFESIYTGPVKTGSRVYIYGQCLMQKETDSCKSKVQVIKKIKTVFSIQFDI